jgi:hypothetical protein
VTNGTDSVIRNSGILVEDCIFEAERSTFEGLLVFNSQYVTIRNNSFTGGSKAPGVGIFQNVRDILVTRNEFTDLATGLYFSQSTNDITISHNRFAGNINGIDGANQSDNGNFGFLTVSSLMIDNNDFIANNDIAVRLGAVDRGYVNNNFFYINAANSLVFDKGNATGPGPAPNSAVTNFSVTGNRFLDNNTSSSLYQLHAAILFQHIGGALNLTLEGNELWDDQQTPTQLDAITFNGPFNWSNINIVGGRIAAYGGGSSITAVGGATLSGLSLLNVQDVSGIPSNSLASTTTPVPVGGLTDCTVAVKGAVANVTDSITKLGGQTLKGGGQNTVLAFCDGADWTVLGTGD